MLRHNLGDESKSKLFQLMRSILVPRKKIVSKYTHMMSVEKINMVNALSTEFANQITRVAN